MISIIVPVYNGEKYLDCCIQSIVSQTYMDLDIILIDDCSDDNSLEICKKFAKQDNRIKVLSTEVNSGAAKARNIGLNAAQGEFIAFVDHDDFIDINFIKILFEKQQYYNADIVQCRFAKFKNFDNQEYVFSNVQDVIYDNNKVLKTLLGREGVQSCVLFNKIYRKDLFDTISFDDGKYHEDVFIIHKILHKAKKIVFIDNALYHYRRSPDSFTLKPFSQARLDLLEAFEARIYYFKKINLELYVLSIAQLADTLINFYYNMKKCNYKNKDDIYLIRSTFKIYYKIIRKYSKMIKEPDNNYQLFLYFPKSYYLLKYRKCLDYVSV